MLANIEIPRHQPSLTEASGLISRLRWPLAIVILIAGIDAAWLLLTPLRITGGSARFLLNVGVILAAGTLLLRYFQLPERVRVLVGGLTFLLVAWPALRLFNHLTMTLAFPLADSRLSRWDGLIGFDWFAYLHWVDARPALVKAMEATYIGLTGYSCLLFVLLALRPEPARRCAEMIGLFVMTAFVCIMIGLAFPADAAMTYYAPPAGTFTHFNSGTGAYHLASLVELRHNPAHQFDLATLPGLVTFPSFHTAMGVLAIYCSRGSPYIFLPMLAVNSVMIASTPVFGSHYGIDVIAGMAVTVGVIVTYRSVERKGRLAINIAEAGGAECAHRPCEMTEMAEDRRTPAPLKAA